MFLFAKLSCTNNGFVALTRVSCLVTCPTSSTGGNQVCGCPKNFNQINCVSVCPYQCEICTEFIAGTVSCAFCSGLNKRIWVNVAGGNCQCYTGYYDDGTSPTCQACLPTCLTCANPTTCLSCDTAIRTLSVSQ